MNRNELSGYIGVSNVLVTGTNGFIGSALRERLLAEGWQVRGSNDGSAFREKLDRRWGTGEPEVRSRNSEITG